MDGPSTRLRMRVSPGAGQSAIVGRHGEAWKVRIGAVPERGKANSAVLDLLSEALAIPRARVEVVAGRSARDKVIAVAGLSEDEVERRLALATR